MKKLYIYTIFATLGLSLLTESKSFSQTLTAGDVPTTLCANEGFSLSYSFSGATINAGNEFRAQISDNTGTFSTNSNVDIIGSITSTAITETIYVTIPYTTPTTGTGYRIRIIATNTSAGLVYGTANLSGAIDISCTTRDYYWTGGTGNWSDLNHWDYTIDGSTFIPASEIPQPNDNVNFDNQSFPNGGELNFDQYININDMYWEPGSGATNPLIQSNWYGLQLKGELILDAGVITSFWEIYFNSTKQYIEVNYGDNILADPYVGRVRFSGGGSWDLNSEMTAEGIELYDASTFSTNDFDLDLLSGSLWDDGTICTFNSGTSNIYLGSLSISQTQINGSATWYFNDGYYIRANDPLNVVVIESGDYVLDSDITMNELIIMPGVNLDLRGNSTQTILVNFEAVGTRDKIITIQSTVDGTQATLSIAGGASLTADFVALKDNIVTGATPYAIDNWIDNGNNSGWDFNILNKLTALDYYWVGGSGNWSDNLAHWGKLPGGGGFRASPPGAVDNVYFTSSSFPTGGTIFIDDNVACNDMEWQPGAGATSPKIRGNNTAITINGDLTLDNGVTRSVNFNFQSLVGNIQNLDFADNLFESGSITLNGEGTWDLWSDLEADELSFNGGTFNTNDAQIDIFRIYFNSSLATVNWGASTVYLQDLHNQTGGAVTFNAGTSSFYFGNSTSDLPYLRGPFTLNDVTMVGNVSIDNNNTFKYLTIEQGSKITLQNNTTQTIDIDGDFTAMGLRDQPITIRSNSPGILASFSQNTGTNASNASSFLIIEDVNTTGTLPFDTDYSSYNGTNLSGGTLFNGWVFGQLLDTPLDFYWVGNSGNWSDYANHWATSEDGSTMHIFAPGAGDNIFFTASSFTSIGQTVTLDNPVKVNNMIWNVNSGSNAPRIVGLLDYTNNTDNSLTVTGELKFAPGVTRAINHIIFESANTNNIDFADNLGTFDYPDRIDFRGGGTWNLLSDMDGYQVYIEDATFNTNDFDIDFYAITLGATNSIVNLGTSNAYLKDVYDNSGGGASLNALTATVFIYDNAFFSNNFMFGKAQVFDGGSLLLLGNIAIYDFTLDPGSELTFIPSYTLTTTSFSALGTSGKPIKINSSLSGNQGFISMASGIVNASYLLISDNGAMGGATFNLNSSLITGDPAKVTGWNITPPANNIYNWIGGSGNWSDIAHWEFSVDGGTLFNPALSPPGMSDDVFFNASSFTVAGEQVFIDQPAYCHDMTWTTNASQSPTISGPEDTPLTIFGSLTMANGVYRNVFEIKFESYVSGNTIDLADNLVGGFFESIDFIGSGEWTLLSDMKMREVNFRGGTFNTNDYDLYVDSWSFNNSSPKIFNAGASHFYVSEFTKSNPANLTFNKGTSTFHIVNSNERTNDIDGPFNFNAVIIEADATLESSNAFNSLIVNSGVELTIGDNDNSTIETQFIANNLALNGLANSPVIVNSYRDGVQGIFSVPSSGTVTADYVIFTDNKATGGASFVATNSSQINNVTGWSGLLQGQTINFQPLNDIDLSSTINLTATASSGLAVTYSVVPITGSGSVTTDVLTPASAGLVEVVANQAGNGTYGAAQGVSQYVHFNLGLEANELGQMKEASYAVGVPNGVSEGSYTRTDKSVARAQHAIISPDGKLIVASEGRVMIWNQLPDAYDVAADVVVGQPDFFSDDQTASQTVMAPLPQGAALGSVAIGPLGQLIVSDGRGVLIWNSIPTTNGAPADVIIGQTNFTATTMAVAQDKFLSPSGMAVSNDGKLIVCELGAHRVLVFNSIPTTNGALADVVIGQPDFISSSPGISQKNLNTPAHVAITADNKLLITDAFNNRVLIYNSIPTSNFAPADVVIGQDNFTSGVSGVASNKFNIPVGIAISRTGKMALTDAFNYRVLIYNQVPTSNADLPDLVLGQPDFDTNDIVNEDQITLRDIQFPSGVAWDISENLAITDANLQRVLIYGAADLTPPPAFTTGLVKIIGNAFDNYWNYTSTAVEVTVPIANDQSLNGGTIQLQTKIGSGVFTNIDSLVNIDAANLGAEQIISIDSATLKAAAGYSQNATIVFRAIMADVVNNQTTGTESSSTVIIDTESPAAFTTGAITALAADTIYLVPGYWNANNTGVEVTIPIANDVSLVGGTVQLKMYIDGDSAINIGTPVTILTANLGGDLIISLSKTDFEGIAGLDEGSVVTASASITDVAVNPETLGTASADALLIDRIAPAIDISNSTIVSTYVDGEETKSLIAMAADTSGIKEVKLHFHLISSDLPEEFSTKVLAKDTATNNYVINYADLVNTSAEKHGLIHYLEASDSAGNRYTGVDTKQSVNIKYPNGVTVINFGVGKNTENYKMMAIPLDLENKTVLDVFDEVYDGTYDKSIMRIFSYPGGNSTTYDELSGTSPLNIGVGYFALAASGATVTTPAGATSFETILDPNSKEVEGYSIDLVAGWNMIGNPFMHSVDWAEIETLSQTTAGDLDAPQIYNGTDFPAVSAIPSNTGAFIHNNTASTIPIIIPAYKTTGGRISSRVPNRNPLFEDSWEVLFTAKANDGSKFTIGGIGMELNATFSKDQFDLLNPPAFARMKIMDFDHPEFSASSFKLDVRETTAEEMWEFSYKVENEDNSEHTIGWDNSYFGENAPDIILVDKTHFTTINMKERNSYTFKHGGITKFEVYYGDNALQSLLPEQIVIPTPYPNPFNEQVNLNVGLPQSTTEYKIVVAVYNIMGKQVATLTNGTITSGYHTFTWMGTNDSGKVVPKGIYTYRVIVEGELNEVITGKIVKY